MKKAIASIITLLMTLTLAACDSGAGNIVIGDYVEFGDYNWQVLEIKGGNALIISERIIEFRPYHNTAEDVTWENCDLRKYLNNEFYTSFSEEEQKRIILTKNENPDNPWDFTEQGGEAFTEGGNDTKDYIFLLSLDEIIEYYTNDGKESMLYQSQLGANEVKLSDGYEDNRLAYRTNGDVSEASGGSWYLRSPGLQSDAVAYIGGKGSIVVQGTWVEETDTGVRPAMWVKNAKTLKKSVICDNPDCRICNSNLYKGNYNPDADGNCPICGFEGTECKDKVKHNRLYHDWVFGRNNIGVELIEEITAIKEKYDETWFKLIDILKDGTLSINEDAGTYRQATLVSHDMYNRINALLIDKTATHYNYRAMSESEIEELEYKLNAEITVLEEVIKVSQGTLSEINANAKTYEEDMKQFISAIAYEYIRTKVKENVEESSRELWDAGYYHSMYGSALDGYTFEDFNALTQEQIDELFGENQIIYYIDGDGAVLDGYFETIFFK